MISARSKDRVQAQAHLTKARQLAEAVGRDAKYLWTAFEPTNVGTHYVAVAAELGDYQRAATLG